jgi:hypothetical protein
LQACCRIKAEVDTGWKDLLWMLANLTGLVAGEFKTKQQKVLVSMLVKLKSQAS